MYLDLGVGPVIRWTPPQEMGILHLPEGILNVVLGAIGADTVFIGPAGVVGEQNRFAELNPAEAAERCLVGVIGEIQTLANGAGSTGSRRVRIVPRYQSARCTLLVGATARLIAASSR